MNMVHVYGVCVCVYVFVRAYAYVSLTCTLECRECERVRGDSLECGGFGVHIHDGYGSLGGEDAMSLAEDLPVGVGGVRVCVCMSLCEYEYEYECVSLCVYGCMSV
jgi:hypothetical protein